MSQKCIEEQFNKELEMYIQGLPFSNKVNTENPQEYNELLQIAKQLTDKKTSNQIDEERMRQTFMNQLAKENKSKKVFSIKKVCAATIMVGILGIGMTQTVLGQNIIQSVIAKFTTGHANVLQLDKKAYDAEEKSNIQKTKNEPMPEEYKGKIFDKNGKEFEYFPPYLEGAYNSKGETLLCVKDGVVYTAEEWNALESNEEQIILTDSSILSNYTSFDVSLPTYLPEGITFQSAKVEFPKDNFCIELNFVDQTGKEVIYLQQRSNSEEAAGTGCTFDEVKEVDINGAKGLLYDNSLNWETDKIIYLMNTMDDSLSREEMIKVARSFN